MTLRYIDKALDEITTMTYGGPNPSSSLRIAWMSLPGGGAPRKSGVASLRAKIFEDPNCVDAWL